MTEPIHNTEQIHNVESQLAGESISAVPDLLTGRRVVLRPIDPGDYGFIAALETEPANLIR